MNTENLLKHADFLETVTEFDMQDYYAEGWYTPRNECGTAACALGWAPSIFPALPGEDFDTYCLRVFGFDECSGAWMWFFASEWRGPDNTAKGAAARIRWLIEHGLPNDWKDQMLGAAPLCYQVAT